MRGHSSVLADRPRIYETKTSRKNSDYCASSDCLVFDSKLRAMTDKLLPVDTSERKQAFERAKHCLDMKTRYPQSRFWRYRVRHAILKIQELWGLDAVL